MKSVIQQVYYGHLDACRAGLLANVARPVIQAALDGIGQPVFDQVYNEVNRFIIGAIYDEFGVELFRVFPKYEDSYLTLRPVRPRPGMVWSRRIFEWVEPGTFFRAVNEPAGSNYWHWEQTTKDDPMAKPDITDPGDPSERPPRELCEWAVREQMGREAEKEDYLAEQAEAREREAEDYEREYSANAPYDEDLAEIDRLNAQFGSTAPAAHVMSATATGTAADWDAFAKAGIP